MSSEREAHTEKRLTHTREFLDPFPSSTWSCIRCRRPLVCFGVPLSRGCRCRRINATGQATSCTDCGQTCQWMWMRWLKQLPDPADCHSEPHKHHPICSQAAQRSASQVGQTGWRRSNESSPRNNHSTPFLTSTCLPVSLQLTGWPATCYVPPGSTCLGRVGGCLVVNMQAAGCPFRFDGSSVNFSTRNLHFDRQRPSRLVHVHRINHHILDDTYRGRLIVGNQSSRPLKVLPES